MPQTQCRLKSVRLHMDRKVPRQPGGMPNHMHVTAHIRSTAKGLPSG